MIDINDPIEVGGEEVYKIKVTNQGSLKGRDVTITVKLEAAQEYTSSEPSSATTVRKISKDRRVIEFKPLPELAAKAEAVWTLKVRALRAGDVRFTASMTSATLTRPVQENESTNQYRQY